jgi:hypothetical protein
MEKQYASIEYILWLLKILFYSFYIYLHVYTLFGPLPRHGIFSGDSNM